MLQNLRQSAASGWITAIGLLAGFVPAATAFAQEAPPDPALRRYPAPWLGLLVIFLLLVIVMTVSLIPSKRGHQD